MKLGWGDLWSEVLSGCSGIFYQRSSWGNLGSLLKGQILNSIQQQNWPFQCVDQCQLSKAFMVTSLSDLWLKGQRSKAQICFIERSNFKQPSATKLITPVYWLLLTIITSSWWPLRGQRSEKSKLILMRGQNLNSQKCSWWLLLPTCGSGIKDQKSSNLFQWEIKF